jgi:hypothetical protein
MNVMAQYLGYILMALSTIGGICVIAWLVTEAVWRSIQRAQGVRNALRLLESRGEVVAALDLAVHANPYLTDGEKAQIARARAAVAIGAREDGK